MYTVGRSALAFAAASALCLLGLGSAAGPAGATSVQARSGPFRIGSATSQGGGIAFTSKNGIVVVYDISSARTAVCLIKLGSRKCSHTTDLRPPSGDSNFGTPLVFVPSANHVVVLQQTCCDGNPGGGDLLYSSRNGGRTFAAPVRIDTLNVTTGALIGRQIVFTASNLATTQVESVPVTASGPPASIATAFKEFAYAVGVGQYKGGALIGSDYIGHVSTTTYVQYAPRGSNFDSSASYHHVATFANEHLLAMSGNALLTVQGGHRNAVLLRLLNGRGYGPAHVVPGASAGGPEWFTVCQDPGGDVHVFSERGLVRGYHLIEETTSTGARWSRPADLGNAISNAYFDAALSRSGRGLVLGTAPAWGYPVP
jgi:hypothetical protein